jgi:hypothetical protein
MASAEPIAATSDPSSDDDGDGLVLLQEQIMGSDPNVADTDMDGYSDLEELARNSDPLDAGVIPAGIIPDVGMQARIDAGVLHALIAVYLPGSNPTGIQFEVGARIGAAIYELPPEVYLAGAHVNALPGANPSDAIVIIDSGYPEGVLHALGSLSLCATLVPNGGTQVESAAAVNLLSHGGVAVAIQAAPGGTGSLYRPLGGDDSIPSSWLPEQACVQEQEVVGQDGPMLIKEVTAASCDDADGYCPPDCSGLVGTTVTEIDPLGLIGG